MERPRRSIIYYKKYNTIYQSYILFLKLLTLRHRHLVAAVVFGVLRVALHPVVVELVAVHQLQQLLPQVGVQGGFLVAFHPAPLFPAPGPALLQGVDDILGVGVEFHNTGFLQQGEGGDHRGEFHAVVGGGGLPAGNLLPMGSVEEDRPPPAWSGISGAGAVGIDGHLFHGGLQGFLLLLLGIPPLLHQGNEDESQPKEEENNAA